MGCFCHKTLDQLKPLLPRLNVSASEALALPKLSAALTAKLGAPALPAVAATVSLSVAMPNIQLSMAAIGTIAALADLRASVQEQFGIDLLISAQAAAFARIVATLNARLAALMSLQLNLAPWTRLAALNAAINLGASASASASASAAVALGADIPKLAAAAVLLSAAARLNVNFSANVSAQLSATLRAILGISLPALAAPALVANLSATLSALADLRASLGLDPLKVGFAMTAQVVSVRLEAALKEGLQLRLAASAGLSASLHASLLAALQAALQASAEAKLRMAALAAINWQVPPITALPAITVGLPVCALTAQLKAALGINAVLPAPCGPTCDAAKLAKALS